MRTARPLMVTLCLLAQSPTSRAGPTVVVQASCASTGQADALLHRRLVAWRKGRLVLGRQGVRKISLRVERVVKGKLPAWHLKAPVGVGLVEVLALDDAALATPGLSSRGQWRLHGLPNGAWYVATAADVPATPGLAQKRKWLASVRRLVANKAPAGRYEGLRALADHRLRDFALVPALLADLDSKVQVTNPRGMHFHGKGGHGWMPVKTTLGQEARRILYAMFRPLLTRSSPLADAPAAAWRAWWKGVLATPPFPKIKVAPGPVVELARVPLNQTWPWIMTDPRGEATLTVYTRAHRAVHGARNVITFTPLAAPRTSRAVYRVPPMTSSEPRGARAAWGDRDVGLLWYEERGTTRLEQLLVLSLGGGRPRGKPARLGLGSTGHMTLARLGRGWAVVYESRADHAFYLQRLTARGKRRGKARRLTPTRGGVGFHLGVQALDAVSTPGGAALVLGGGLGVTLILVDRRGRVKHRQRVDDPRATGSGYEPRLARARGRLCVAWKQSDNWDDRVLARAYRLNGTPVGAARVVARHVDALGSLLAEGAGFRLVWSDQNGAANRVAARRLGAGGEPGPVTALFQGRGVVSYLAAGLHGVTLRLTLVDRAAWPQRLMLKETKLTR